MFGTYNRLNLHVYASNREVIRAARRRLKPNCLHDRALSEGRKAFYQTMLRYHEQARALVEEFRL